MQTSQAQPADALVQFAIGAIEDYLVTHPDSADTAEGIHNWWISWPGLPESLHVTVLALHQLQQRGVICAHRLGNREIWRRPRPATP